MKIGFISALLVFISIVGHAKSMQVDSIKLQVEGSNAYYQKTVKVDSNITVSTIYIRALQFMASKNFTQNYGYEQEGKLIFTTTQDLNINDTYSSDDLETVNPYTVQFAISIDMKNKRYRYTIHNIVFYLPTETGNRRLTLYDVYTKTNNRQPKRIIRDATKLITSFEKYIAILTNELYEDIQHKLLIHNSNF